MSSCHPSAEKYFGVAALNCNIFSNFGSTEIKNYLMGEPQTYDSDKKIMKASTYQEYFKFMCVDHAIENYNNLKDLPVTDDTKPMITASLALYEFCIQKYQQEYLEIAKLKDGNQPLSKIEGALKNFDSAYLQQFAMKYDAAWSEGIIYANKHGIKVTTVNTHFTP